MHRPVLVLTIAVLAFSPLAAVQAATGAVSEVGTSFQPAQIQIAVGDQVVWTNRSSQSHTVTFNNGPDLNPGCDPSIPALLRGGCQAPGTTVQRTFSAPGTYSYHCKLHAAEGMTGAVVVTAAATSSTRSTSSSTTTTLRSSTTSTTRAIGSTTSTTRVLATSSTVVKSTTTTADTSNVLAPGAPPPLSGDDGGSNAAGKSGSDSGDKGTVALIVGLLLAVSGGGGYLLWRLRPGRS